MSSKSDTWKHFIKKESNGICKYCHTEVKTCGNTTNLRNHLLRRHPRVKTVSLRKRTQTNDNVNIDAPSTSNEKFGNDDTLSSGNSKDLCDSDGESVASSITSLEKCKHYQLTMDSCFNNNKAVGVNGNKRSNLNNAIIFMISKDNLPLNTVEKEGFQYLMKTAVPLYKLPSIQTISQIIDDKYDILSLQFKEKLLHIESICLTADLCTDKHNTRSYMGLTGHFIHSGELISIHFGMSHLVKPHNADYLSQVIISMTKKWGISPEKVEAFVTDNCADIVKAITILYGKQKHLRCFAHTLNLIAQKPFDEKCGIETVKPLITIIQDITNYFKQNVNAADALRDVQESAEVPLKLIQSVCTRWNSIYYQLARFVQLSNLIAPILLNHPKSPHMLTASQLDAVKEFINILKPIQAVTKGMSAEKYVSASKVIPIVSCLLERYSSMRTETAVGIATKKLIVEELKKRFDTAEQVNILAITTLLDPRFKKIHFSDQVSCSTAIDKINSMLVSKKQLDNNLNCENLESSAEYPAREAQELSIWEFHKKLVTNQLTSIKQESQAQGLQDELKQYFSQPVADFNTTDPITYWHNQKNSLFNSITPIANKYFCVVGTSVSCERLFSIAENIVTEERSRLDPDRLDKLVFLKSLNLKYWQM